MMEKEKLKAALDLEAKKFEAHFLWLEKSMPGIFFREVPSDWIFLIVHALVTFKEQNHFAQIVFPESAIVLCLDREDSDVQILSGFDKVGIKNYTTYISKTPFDEGGRLRIATLFFTEVPKFQELEKKEEIVASLIAKDSTLTHETVEELLGLVDPTFLRKLDVESQINALYLFSRARTRDHCQYEVKIVEHWEDKDSPSHFILLAWKNVQKHHFLRRLSQTVFNHNLVMRRVNATYVNPYSPHSVLILSFGLHGKKGEAATEACDIADFLQEMISLKYFGSFDLINQTFVQKGLISGNLGNLLRTMVTFIHQVLVNANPHLYTFESVQECLCRHPELTMKLLEAFEYRFNPKKQNLQYFEEKKEEFLGLVMQLDTGYAVLDQRRKNVLLQGMNFVTHVQKTNFYCTNKTSFVFRLDPTYLDHAPFDRKTLFPELPFGIFFFKGMHYFAFHIRFRDLARGGLRTIFPEKKERVLAEHGGVFSECYHLALTQNYKNKDIPEGGAKGVIFLKPDQHLDEEVAILSRELQVSGMGEEEIEKRIHTFKQEQKLEYLYQTQRAYIKNFLTLINCDLDGKLKAKSVVDYYQQPEYIYLGPDENMHDSMITWIAETAVKENYKPKGAFISGKPHSGINHKKYGVTSLGVHVYLQEVLAFLGINPKEEAFTVKMTGGPDGDVAGNEILNLYRDYPKTAKLIALTDVSGTIYDPQGIDLATCVDLFHAEKSIRFYPTEKLSQQGFLLDRETRKEISSYVFHTKCFRNGQEEWINGNEMNALFRNNVHQQKADIFIPCGGRPRTLREENVGEFLEKTGAPTARAIVEGANLYFSNEARKILEEKGVLVVKDSSANKCGVISSSYEVLAGLVLTEELFVAHKEELVVEILERLEKCARDEARLLLETHERTKEPLTRISDQISNRIIALTDELDVYLRREPIEKNPHFVRCFLEHALPFLRKNYRTELMREIPENHKRAIVASFIASHIVYQKGLEWSPQVVDVLPLILEELF